jgi:hypothetical protein
MGTAVQVVIGGGFDAMRWQHILETHQPRLTEAQGNGVQCIWFSFLVVEQTIGYKKD